MKKQILLFFQILTMVSLFAQNIKPGEGNRLVELKMSGLLSSPDAGLNSQYGGFMIRKFNTASKARRISADLGFSVKDSTYTISNAAINFGEEIHFTGTDKLSPYWGWDMGVKMRNFTENKMDNLGMSCGLFTGFDFYLVKGIYLGAEIGYSLNVEMNPFSVGTGGAASRAGLKFGYMLN